MKKTLPALAVSLAANVILLALLLRPPASVPAITTGESRPGPTPNPAAATGPLSPADAATLTHSRELLATGDLPTLVARLRAAGYSPSDIRGIVAARLSQVYGARRAAAVAQQEVVPYWRSSQSFPEDPKVGAIVTGLIREQAAQLKQLLGPDSDPDDAWSRLIQQRQYGYLPADKVQRLQGILTDYNDMRNAIGREGHGLWLPEDQAKQALLEKETVEANEVAQILLGTKMPKEAQLY